jgi:hypothetical protein
MREVWGREIREEEDMRGVTTKKKGFNDGLLVSV